MGIAEMNAARGRRSCGLPSGTAAYAGINTQPHGILRVSTDHSSDNGRINRRGWLESLPLVHPSP